MLPRRQITPHTNTYAYLSEVTLIISNLYLSSLSAIRSSSLVELGITHIVTILDFDVQFENWSGNRLVIKLLDGTQANLLDRLDECVEFIQKARSEGGKVVVHCMMGLSRSVCVVAACLIVELGVSADDALNQIKEKRGTIQPNDGFVMQLKEYERRRLGYTARSGKFWRWWREARSKRIR